MSSTVPVTLTPACPAALNTRGDGFRPAIVRETPDISRRTNGRIVSRRYTMAYSLGYQSMETVNTRCPGTSALPFGAKYATSTPDGTAQTLALGARAAW